jgi:ABC-type phosphate transport system ATPase subunit
MFLWDGDIVEIGQTSEIFYGGAQQQRTRDYVSGVFG